LFPNGFLDPSGFQNLRLGAFGDFWRLPQSVAQKVTIKQPYLAAGVSVLGLETWLCGRLGAFGGQGFTAEAAVASGCVGPDVGEAESRPARATFGTLGKVVVRQK
jgi:hypothetical protein